MSSKNQTKPNFFDQKPFCYAPGLFPGSLKQFTDQIVGFNTPEELNGDWYTLGFRDQPWNKSPCLMQSYKWDSTKKEYTAWYGCITEGDRRYINVTMAPKNNKITQFNGYMRFSRNGRFWAPFKLWIVDMAQDKSWFLCCDPCRTMAFLMSRTPKIDPRLYTTLVAKMKDTYGIRTDDFVPLSQSYNGH